MDLSTPIDEALAGIAAEPISLPGQRTLAERNADYEAQIAREDARRADRHERKLAAERELTARINAEHGGKLIGQRDMQATSVGWMVERLNTQFAGAR